MTDTAKRMTFPNPLLVVVSGPSASERASIVAELARQHPQVVPTVTATTRPQRNGEVDGVHYHFTDRSAFATCATVAGCWNGPRSTGTCTERRSTRSAASCCRPRRHPDDRPAGRPPGEGARARRAPHLRHAASDGVDLTQWASGPRFQSEASLERRRTDAERWIAESGDYDHVVVNETGRPAEAADRIWDIIHAEARRDSPRRPRF